MNAHLSFSFTPFQNSSLFSKELQQQKNETGQLSDAEKSLAQLLNIDYKSCSAMPSSLPSNTMNINMDLFKASDLMPSQRDISNYNTHNLVSTRAAQQTAGVPSDVLNRLLFQAPFQPITTADFVCQQALNEIQSTNTFLDTPQATQDTAFEPSPINEKKMKVLLQQEDVSDANAFQLWRQQQQQQMQSLLNMVFQSSSSTNLQQTPAVNLRSLMAGSGNANESAERSLHPSNFLSSNLADPDVFRPAKKQRVATTNVPTAPVAPIVEDSMNQSGRFRDYQSCQWSVRFHELQLFQKEKGHCCVPHGYPQNVVLARWVKRQRYQYKLRAEGKPSTMTIERINSLEGIGFIWDSHGACWMERYNELEDYANKHGSCNISSIYVSIHGTQLSSWVKCQRRQYKMYMDKKPTNMTKERISKLESIGFEWELRRSRNSVSDITSSDKSA